MYETRLKDLNPGVRELTYDVRFVCLLPSPFLFPASCVSPAIFHSSALSHMPFFPPQWSQSKRKLVLFLLFSVLRRPSAYFCRLFLSNELASFLSQSNRYNCPTVFPRFFVILTCCTHMCAPKQATDLFKFIDSLTDMSALVFDHTHNEYKPFDKDWIKARLLSHLKKIAGK